MNFDYVIMEIRVRLRKCSKEPFYDEVALLGYDTALYCKNDALFWDIFLIPSACFIKPEDEIKKDIL